MRGNAGGGAGGTAGTPVPPPSQRKAGEAYTPAGNDAFLKEVYGNPLAEVPASSGAGGAAGGAPSGPGMEGRLTLLENLIKASRSIAMELDPLKATKNIIDEACGILHADRATIFKVRATGPLAPSGALALARREHTAPAITRRWTRRGTSWS